MVVKKDFHQIIVRPVITEKSTRRKEENRELCFEVPREANKIEIRKAVEHLFKTKVDKVRTQARTGKVKRVSRNTGRTKDWKLAYVRIKAGEKMIEFLEAV
jgi:large subunit ribosomal protein L23